jgi:hypothetical protein
MQWNGIGFVPIRLHARSSAAQFVGANGKISPIDLSLAFGARFD